MLPVTSREPVEPAPQVRSASTPPSITVGVLGQAEVVVGGQVELGADGRTRTQRAAQSGCAPLLLDLVEPGQRGKTDASHLTVPLTRRRADLNSVQVNARATPTIAEVICPISSGVQMYGGIT